MTYYTLYTSIVYIIVFEKMHGLQYCA